MSDNYAPETNENFCRERGKRKQTSVSNGKWQRSNCKWKEEERIKEQGKSKSKRQRSKMKDARPDNEPRTTNYWRLKD